MSGAAAGRGIIHAVPARLPKLPTQTGEYAVEWFLDDRVIPGELSLEASRPPQAGLFGDVVRKDWRQGGGFPEDHNFDRVVGRLRSGPDVVLTDAHLSIWFMERSLGTARHAVVGLEIADVPGDAFHRSRFQITNLDLLFGVAPIKSVTWPAAGRPRLDGQYAIETNPAAHHEWINDDAGLSIECTYDLQFPLSSGHHHFVAFAPTISIASDEPLTVDRWINEWVMPLLRLATLATRMPQRLSWLTVNTAPRDTSDDERLRSTTGTVFGSGIEQEPYEAEYRDEWREQGNRPLFTMASIPMSLPALVRNWRSLEHDENPFLELLGLTLRLSDLPLRARFLYLVQALEALHSSEHRTADDAKQEAFEARRAEILDALAAVELPPGALRFIKDGWSKRRADSLDRRLRELIDQLPPAVRALVANPPDGDVLAAMAGGAPQPVAHPAQRSVPRKPQPRRTVAAPVGRARGDDLPGARTASSRLRRRGDRGGTRCALGTAAAEVGERGRRVGPLILLLETGLGDRVHAAALRCQCDVRRTPRAASYLLVPAARCSARRRGLQRAATSDHAGRRYGSWTRGSVCDGVLHLRLDVGCSHGLARD